RTHRASRAPLPPRACTGSPAGCRGENGCAPSSGPWPGSWSCRSGSRAWWSSGPSSVGQELLAAVDVVGRAGEGGVGHEMHRQRRNVGWSHDATDGERGAKLCPARLELVAEDLGGEGRVDEGGRRHVHPDRLRLHLQGG